MSKQKISISLADEAFSTVAAAVALQNLHGSVQDGAYSLVDEMGGLVKVGAVVLDEKAKKVEIVGGIAPKVYGGHGRVIVSYHGVLDVVSANSLNLFWVETEALEEA